MFILKLIRARKKRILKEKIIVSMMGNKKTGDSLSWIIEDAETVSLAIYPPLV